MHKGWWRVTVALLVTLMLGMSIVGCGGNDEEDGGSSGGNDNDKLKARMESFVNHLNKQDATGVLNDLPPDVRKDCKEDDLKTSLDAIKGLSITFKLKDFKVRSVEGNNATADIKIESTAFGKTEEMDDAQKFLKAGSDWYIDNEGKACADVL